MPLTEDEWKSGRKWDTPEAQILTFLKKQGKPLTQTEITDGIGTQNPTTGFWGFVGVMAKYLGVGEALKILIKEGTVEARTIKTRTIEETYYRAK